MDATDVSVPLSEPQSSVRFSGFVLDLDACVLKRESGEPVALTRSEFALLRFLVGRRGRVASRETLLNAIANRPLMPFDRTVDVVVGRLRRKIEPDPKHPRLVVTVPGEGYRFDGAMLPSAAAPAAGSEPAWPAPLDYAPRVHAQPSAWSRVSYVIAALCLALLAALVGALSHQPANRQSPTATPSVAILPFANLTGDASSDFLARTLTVEVTAFLAAYPGVRVVSAPALARYPTVDALQAGQAGDAQYVVQGGVHRLRDTLRVTATLYDGATRTALWSQVFDSASNGAIGLQEDISRRIYDSLAGFRGTIHTSEERVAWNKSSVELNEHDYYLRGASAYRRFTLPDVLKARAIFQEGLDRYPNSVLLHIELAWTYLWSAMNEVNSDPRPNIDRAWRLANEALSAQSASPLEAWLTHWLMAFLFQWRDNDFSLSVAEARKAVELVPYDSYSRNDLSWILANAGYGEEAIAWARSGPDHDPNGPSRYYANLAWAYYVAGRDQEAVAALRERSAEFPVLHAALLVRLGEVEKAKGVIADYLNSGGGDTVGREDIIPLVEPAGTKYLEILRKSGLPEK